MDLQLITPTKAKELLAANTHNRNVKDWHVANLASDMLQGRWRERTGESIKIGKNNVLLDGQHRLLAVIKAGKAIRFLIHEDLDDNIQEVLDTGVKRTSGDSLKLANIKNANNVAAIIKVVLSGLQSKSTASAGITNRTILEEYKKDPVFWDNVVANSVSWYSQLRALPPTLFGLCYVSVLRESKKPARAIEFFSGLASGKDTASSIISLRNKIINDRLSTKRLTSAAKIEVIRGGWNAYLSGNKTSHSNKTKEWL